MPNEFDRCKNCKAWTKRGAVHCDDCQRRISYGKVIVLLRDHGQVWNALDALTWTWTLRKREIIQRRREANEEAREAGRDAREAYHEGRHDGRRDAGDF